MPEERQALPNAHLERSGRRLRTLPGTARAFAAAAGCHCRLAGVLLVPCSRSLRPRLLPVPRSFLSTVDGVILLKVNVPPSLLRSKIISLRAMVSHLVTMEAQTLAASSEARLGRPRYLLVRPAAPLPTTPRPGRLALPRPHQALSSRCPCTCALRLGRLCQRPRITLGPPARLCSSSIFSVRPPLATVPVTESASLIPSCRVPSPTPPALCPAAFRAFLPAEPSSGVGLLWRGRQPLSGRALRLLCSPIRHSTQHRAGRTTGAQ